MMCACVCVCNDSAPYTYIYIYVCIFIRLKRDVSGVGVVAGSQEPFDEGALFSIPLCEIACCLMHFGSSK